MAATRRTPIVRNVVGDAYNALIRRFPLRPIRSDDELAEANSVIDLLLDRDERTEDEEDYLDVLSDLVEQYEDRRHPMPPVSDAEMLAYLIESRGVTQADVATATGIARPTISAILAGRRGLNRNHIAALAGYFKVSPAVFIATA